MSGTNPSRFKIFEPTLLFGDETKTLGDLIKLFECIHADIGGVLSELRQLEEEHKRVKLIPMNTHLSAYQMYSFSIGLLRLADASLTVQTLLLKDTVGLGPSQTMLLEAGGQVKAALESHICKYQLAKEDFLKTKDKDQVCIMRRFLDALFPSSDSLCEFDETRGPFPHTHAMKKTISGDSAISTDSLPFSLGNPPPRNELSLSTTPRSFIMMAVSNTFKDCLIESEVRASMAASENENTVGPSIRKSVSKKSGNFFEGDTPIFGTGTYPAPPSTTLSSLLSTLTLFTIESVQEKVDEHFYVTPNRKTVRRKL